MPFNQAHLASLSDPSEVDQSLVYTYYIPYILVMVNIDKFKP